MVTTDKAKSEFRSLDGLSAGQPILFGGDKVIGVSAELAESFKPGDQLVVVNETGALLHIPQAESAIAKEAVGLAYQAFGQMGSISDAAVSDFFEKFAAGLADEAVFGPIAAANKADMVLAKQRGRSTTRLELTKKMRQEMVEGLRAWRDTKSGRDSVVETVVHDGWQLEQRKAGLGVVGFVFEGRPNVFADACGVLRSGNTVVFRIGSDALGTARSIVEHALNPALKAAGLPVGAASLVDSPSHAVGWATFSDPRLGLAVARGSGTAVAQLGAVARQAGIPVSLHGTGGAWMVTGQACDTNNLVSYVAHSLDRKVCNTLNTVCVLRSRAAELVPLILQGLQSAAEARGSQPKLHVAENSLALAPNDWLERLVQIERPDGVNHEPQAEVLPVSQIGQEWEWESSPEITLVGVDSVEEAVGHFNRYSPRFVASLISSDETEFDHFWAAVDAPFVGNGFTRWVDGQYALKLPELGLSNWQFGRLFARGAVLSGDSVFTVRSRVHQTDPEVYR